MSRIGEWWRSWWQRYQKTVEEYGNVAIATYLLVLVGTLAGFYVAMRAGLDVAGGAGTAGTVGAAYVATKLAQPARIAATLVLTPMMVQVIRAARRWFGWTRPPAPPAP